MQRYWRLKDIPELRDVPVPDRRRLWGEATTRTVTVSVLLGTLLGYFAIIGPVAVAVAVLWHESLWASGFGLCLSMLLPGFINEYWFVQPRARQWLRLHAPDMRAAG